MSAHECADLLDLFRGKGFVVHRLKGTRNNTFRLERGRERLILKIAKEKGIRREVAAIGIAAMYRGVNVPHLVEHGPNYLVTRFQKGLREQSQERMIHALHHFHEEYAEQGIKNEALPEIMAKDFFPRGRIFEDFMKHRHIFVDQLRGDEIEKNISPESIEGPIPIGRVLCHGDAHRKNILANGDIPFFIDFEFSHFNYATFDISTNVFSEPDKASKSVALYLEIARRKNSNTFDETCVRKQIARDALRICTYDVIKSSERIDDKEALLRRLGHTQKVISAALSFL